MLVPRSEAAPRGSGVRHKSCKDLCRTALVPFGINTSPISGEPALRAAQLRCGHSLLVIGGSAPAPTGASPEWGPTPAAPPAPNTTAFANMAEFLWTALAPAAQRKEGA